MSTRRRTPKTPTIRLSLEGDRLTSCCGAYSTFDLDDKVLVCRACQKEVPLGEGDGSIPRADMVSLLADRFVADLREELGAEKFTTVQTRNDTPEYKTTGCCASHDFCDANQVILDSLKALTGREADPDFETEWDAAMDLCDRAWIIARARHLTLSPTT